MYIRKIKRKCGVRGCKCIESYAISRTREPGNSIIACKSCLEAALEAIRDGRDSISRANGAADSVVSNTDLSNDTVGVSDSSVSADKRARRKKGADK